MKGVILCEGTTDLLMMQYVLQYRYSWNYEGFVENAVTNRLLKKTLKKDGNYIEIQSCGGMMNIPFRLKALKDQMEYATKKQELVDRVVVLIDHDTIVSNREFVDKLNQSLQTQFTEYDINTKCKWTIDNPILGKCQVDLSLRCIPEKETGAIEKIMLEALATDNVEQSIIDDSTTFISQMSKKQDRYLQKKALIAKAVFNTYFSIRTPEEKYDERARILKAFDWKNNDIINKCFNFLDFSV